jgi:hypothetical protein
MVVLQAQMEPQELLEQQEQTEPRERQGQLEFLALMEQLVARELLE